MGISDEEREQLAAALLHASPAQLDELHAKLVRQRTDLEDLNSAYPATKEFLEARGLTNVRELDEEGTQAPIKHLLRKLQ